MISRSGHNHNHRRSLHRRQNVLCGNGRATVWAATAFSVTGLACFLFSSGFARRAGRWNGVVSYRGVDGLGAVRRDAPLRLVIHTGPTKTGTTTIQCALTTLAYSLGKRDDYLFVGKNPYQCRERPMGNHVAPLESWALAGRLGTRTQDSNSRLPNNMPEMIGGVEEIKRRAKVMRLLHKARREGRHVLLSDERFQFRPPNVELIRYLQNEEKWDVRVIVTYRRYFETLVSYYNQTRKRQAEKWQKNKPSIVTFLQKHLYRDRGRYNEEKRLLDTSIEAVTRDKVVVFNFHGHNGGVGNNTDRDDDDANMVESFLCDALPGAERTCAVVRETNADPERREEHTNEVKNARQELTGMLLANAAHEADLVDATADKVAVVAAVEQRLEELGESELPQTCLTPGQTATLLELSLELEEIMVPAFAATHMEDHKRAFEKSVANGEFCEVDVRQILADDDEWRQFFLAFKKKKIGSTFAAKRKKNKSTKERTRRRTRTKQRRLTSSANKSNGARARSRSDEEGSFLSS